MKKLVIFFIAAATVTSCSTNAEKNPSGETPQTANELQSKEEAEGLQRAKEHILDSISLANIRQHTIDSMNAAKASQGIATTPVHHLARHTSAPTAPAPAGTQPQATSRTASAPVATTAAAPEKKKSGFTDAVKGGLIGLGTGAAAGAVIDKNNRGQGAVVGGVLGAVGGIATGAILDHHKKKKAEKDTAKTNP